MKVILKEEVENLGKIGDTVNVKPGFARNFLIPKNYAAEASTKNLKAFEHEKKVIQDRARKFYDASKNLADRISTVSLTIKAKVGEEEKLFGSITTMDIAEALKAEGIEIDKRKIMLSEPIKRLGEYKVDIKVAKDIAASIAVKVVQE